jgi:ketosteroid isomerase-like protein
MTRRDTAADDKVERARVLAANERFYAALRESDFNAMDALWSRRKAVAVFHPNWRGIDGRDAVMESWYRILVSGTPPPIHPVEPTAIVNRATGLVICEEDVDGVRLLATNVFINEDGHWRMTHHQASPLPVATSRPDRTRKD